MSKKIYCDLCKNIIKTDYKIAKAKIKDVKQNSNDKYKWEKIDICINCYNKIFIPSIYTVEFDKVSDDTIERIISG